MNDEKRWELTFSDMLTLLLTFFVFILSVSSFKTDKYKEFWDAQDQEKVERAKTTSFKFELIKGIKMPRLDSKAEQLLTELEETFESGEFSGLDVHYSEHKITLMVSEQLSFDGGKAELKEDAKPLLLKLIPGIKKSTFDIEVEGHSDSLSSEKIDNMELSIGRALSVARYLVEEGVDKRKLSVSGYGPYRPVADNKTLEGRQRNRRVEINVIINK